MDVVAPGHPWFSAAAIVALAAALAVVAAILGEGAGPTIDEPINRGHGATLTAAALGQLPESGARLIDRVWRHGHEHPPLTRFLVGVGDRCAHDGGRWASAAALFGILALVGFAARAVAGHAAAWVAVVATGTLPRLAAHGAVASPEVVAAFFMLLAWLAAARALQRGRGWFAVGVCLGLAGLCKLTAILVPLTLLPVIVWHGMTRPARRLAPHPNPPPETEGGSNLWSLGTALVVWWGTAAALFFACWPWLWPVDLPGYPAGWAGSAARLKEFLLTGSDRATIYTWYFSKQYAGNAAPWHYVWVWCFATVTPAALVLGIAGLAAWWRGPADVGKTAVVAAWLGSMLFFTLPVHRYDAERLFLFAFPLWGIVAGWGAAAALRRGTGAVLLAVLLASAAWDSVRMAPLGLSYFSPLAGSLPGAEKLGLELAYWGDSLEETFVRNAVARHVPPGATIELRPALFEGHTRAVAAMIGPAARRGEAERTLVAPRPGGNPAATWALYFRRDGYLSDAERAAANRNVAAEVARDGVWLARLVRLKP